MFLHTKFKKENKKFTSISKDAASTWCLLHHKMYYTIKVIYETAAKIHMKMILKMYENISNGITKRWLKSDDVGVFLVTEIECTLKYWIKLINDAPKTF